MSKIAALDFANNVRQNKQRLIQHCLDNLVPASDSDSLDEVVAKNNTITVEQNGIKVEFVDIDGTVLKTEYVEPGTAATPPTTNPNFDPDCLEFVR